MLRFCLAGFHFACGDFRCGWIFAGLALLLGGARMGQGQEITVERLDVDSLVVGHVSGRPLVGGNVPGVQGVIPGGTTYDVHNAVGTGALGFFLITDPSFPGEPDNIVNFDSIPEALATDVDGTVVSVNESDVAGAGTTHTITITAVAPAGRDIFPGGLTSGGFPLTNAAIFIGVINNDRVDTDPGSIVDSASLEFFTNGISVAGPFAVAGIVGNSDGVWEGDFGVSIGNLAGFGADQWTLIVTITEDVNGCAESNCPTDITPPGGNGTTNIDDLVAVLNDFGSVGPPRVEGDVTPACGNWVVNIDDLVFILNNFGPCTFIPGDLCQDAIPVATGSTAFDSTGFTQGISVGLPPCVLPNAPNADIWFVWTAPSGPNPFHVTADLCGSIPDFAMFVFPNDCLLMLSAMACGDDNATACPGTLQPEVNWVASPGFSYLLEVSNWQGGGVGTLNITATEITNDECIRALPLGVNAPFIADDNTNALIEIPPAPDCGPSSDGLSFGTAPVQTDGGRWFSVIGTGNVLKATTCDPAQLSFYFTSINIYCGGCPLQFCVGDSSDIVCGFGPYAEIDWCSRLGEEYLILIHGQDLAGMPELFSLRVEDAGVACANAGVCTPPGDTCLTAQVMTIIPGAGPSGEPQGTFAVDNTIMNTTIPMDVGNCGGNPGTFGGTETSRDQWITFTATTSGNARIDTCGAGFDTIINLWDFPVGSDCALTNANIVVCNDDYNNGGSNTCLEPLVNPFPSSVEVSITAGRVYHISVSEWGTGGSGGTAQLRVIENFIPLGACQVGGICTPNVTEASCATQCGDFISGGICAVIPTGACCVGGACVGIDTRQGCGTNGSAARYIDGVTDCVGVDCTDSCTASVASNGPFNGVNGVRPTKGFNVLGAGDDFALDAPTTLSGLRLGMIYNVGAGAGPVSGAVQYEITMYELGTPGLVGSVCDAPTIADLVPSTSVPVAGPVLLSGVTLTIGAGTFGGHHEIVEGNFPVPINLAAGRYFMVIRVLDDPLNLFWGTADGAADGSAGESAIFGIGGTVPPPVDVNAADGQRDHAFCIN